MCVHNDLFCICTYLYKILFCSSFKNDFDWDSRHIRLLEYTWPLTGAAHRCLYGNGSFLLYLARSESTERAPNASTTIHKYLHKTGDTGGEEVEGWIEGRKCLSQFS